MKSAAIISKPQKAELSQIIPGLVQWLESHGYTVFMDRESAEYISNSHQVVDRSEVAEQKPSFVIVLGGDGTLLSAARAVAPHEIPILGVNLGSLGFLTEVPLAELYPTLRALDANDCEVECRAMLHARHVRDGKQLAEYHALNDAVISKTTIARLASFDIYIDGAYVSNYRGDGVIVSTPTGSTAYSLATGGPILMPQVQALEISPICPHSLSHRPLVVRDTVEIEILVQAATEEAFLSIDGQIGVPMAEGDKLICRKAPYNTRLLRLRKSFFEVLRTKLKWGQR
ncbi:MAG TPA: NAD(+)/NADH kinase [Terriglobales bacterium]|nr:NAD(+)/NADH kinase [Terriglobales bacterium]